MMLRGNQLESILWSQSLSKVLFLSFLLFEAKRKEDKGVGGVNFLN